MLGGFIGFQDLFSLEKFTPEQAAEVFKVMATEAGLTFDSSFINEMIRNELAEKETEEGIASLKVSPVSMQILAWLIAGQHASETRAFDRSAFRELGGVDGLMEQFLGRVLDGRGTKKPTDIKVLMALINRDRKTRAGVLTTDTILERDKTLTRQDVNESLVYLASPAARLIIQETAGNKLTHERLINALLKTAGFVLGPQEQANQLLNSRLSMWVDSRKSNRLLLSLSEWITIQKYHSSIIWAVTSQENSKRDFIRQSTLYWQRRLWILISVLIIGLSGYIWLQSPYGQMWQMECNLYSLSRAESLKSKVWAIRTLTITGRVTEALTATNSFDDGDKTYALSSIVTGLVQLKNSNGLQEVLAATNSLNDGDKAQVLSEIATGFAQLKDSTQSKATLKTALVTLTTSNSLGTSYKAQVLSEIATKFVQLKDKYSLQHILTAANSLDDGDRAQVLSTIATGFTQLKDSNGLRQILAASNSLSDGNKARVLSIIATGFTQLKDSNGLRQILVATSSLGVSYKAQVLSKIATGFAQLRDSSDLRHLLTITSSLSDGDRARVLSKVAIGFTQLKDSNGLRQILVATSSLMSGDKAQVLSTIATGFTQLKDIIQAKVILKAALIDVKSLNDDYKEQMLSIIATGFVQLRDNDGLKEVLAATNSLSDSDRAQVLSTIATGFTQLKDWRMVYFIINHEIRSDEMKAKTLYRVFVIRDTENQPERQRELLTLFQESEFNP